MASVCQYVNIRLKVQLGSTRILNDSVNYMLLKRWIFGKAGLIYNHVRGDDLFTYSVLSVKYTGIALRQRVSIM